MNKNIQRLQEIATNFSKKLEVAQAKVNDMNDILERLLFLRLIKPDLKLMGPVFKEAINDDYESVTYYRWGIFAKKGFGVFLSFCDIGKKPKEDSWHFVNFFALNNTFLMYFPH